MAVEFLAHSVDAPHVNRYDHVSLSTLHWVVKPWTLQVSEPRTHIPYLIMKQHIILAVQFAKTRPFLAVTHAQTLYGGTPHGGKLHGGPPQGRRLTEGLLRMDHLQLGHPQKYTSWWNTQQTNISTSILLRKKCYMNHQNVYCLIDKASKVSAIM